MNNDLYSKKGAKRRVLLTISVFALSVVGYAQEVVNTLHIVLSRLQMEYISPQGLAIFTL